MSRPQVCWRVSARVAAKASKVDVSPVSSWSAARLAAERLELGDDGLGLLGVGGVGDHRVDAVGGEGEGGGTADAAVAAGDQCDALLGRHLGPFGLGWGVSPPAPRARPPQEAGSARDRAVPGYGDGRGAYLSMDREDLADFLRRRREALQTRRRRPPRRAPPPHRRPAPRGGRRARRHVDRLLRADRAAARLAPLARRRSPPSPAPSASPSTSATTSSTWPATSRPRAASAPTTSARRCCGSSTTSTPPRR